MIFSKDVKNLRIYKKQMYLPTLENSSRPNKKTGSAIFLLTPNRNSSISLMRDGLTVNRNRFMSYYIEKDLTYFINSKVMEEDKSTNESYIFESDASEGIDSSCNGAYVSYEGYASDVEVLKKIFDAQDYNNIFNDLRVFENSEKIPLVLRVGEFPAEDNFFEFHIEKVILDDGITDMKKLIIHVPRCIGNAYEEYGKRILNFVYKALFITLHPDQYNTANPQIYADTMTGADTPYANQPFNTKFPGEIFTAEAANQITIENLKDKFKYATTTKFKRQFSTKLNTLQRSMDKIRSNFQITLNIPSVGSPNESAVFPESYISDLEEGTDYITLGDNRILFLDESVQRFDSVLKKILYNDRIRKRSQILELDKAIKNDCNFIKYAYPDLNRYGKRNLFVDLYYYNQTFFKNNTYTLKRGFDIYLDLLDRLINDKRIISAGYSKRTVFIPIKDWNINKATRMWIYRESINPISIIYQLMFIDPAKCKEVFKDTDIFFFDTNRYFKINFSEFEKSEDIKKAAMKFRLFIMKIIANDTFELEDEDNDTTESAESIKTQIYDKIEAKNGVDLTGKDIEAKKDQEIGDNFNRKESKIHKVGVTHNPRDISIAKTKDEIEREKKKEAKANEIIDKLEVKPEIIDTKPSKTISADNEKAKKKEQDMKDLAIAVSKAAEDSSDVDEALDKMNNNDQAKELLQTVQGEDKPDVTATRAARINKLGEELMDKSVKGKTVKEILDEDPEDEPLPVSKLPVQTPIKGWDNMTYMNFDKKYDLDRDIIMCFKHFATVSHPFAIRDIKVEDTSTSEDRKETYTVAIEDYRGKRQTIKLDIPIMKDNRLMLRGNAKVIATQFLNMPILKTDLYAAQIITNYQKIFVYLYRTSTGRSNPIASILIKSLQKYKGTGLKINFGDCSRICSKYQLPIDYIDLASIVDSIELKDINWKIYLNQDTIRSDYPNIDDSKGVPYAVNIKTKEVLYISDMKTFFSQKVVDLLMTDEDFRKIYITQKSTFSGTYVRCSVLNEKIPMILILGFAVGLDKALKRAKVEYRYTDKLTPEDRKDPYIDYIKFNDGYLVYRIDYLSYMLLNGLKDCGVFQYSMADMNTRSTYVEMLDNYGGRIKSDGLENFIDCLIDPITKEVMQHYKLPTDFIGVLLYATSLMCDNKFIRHTDTSSRRIRRAELIAAYTYEALTEAYGLWANQIRHGREQSGLVIKQSAVIDKILQSPISQDDSVNNALGALEETNNISYKGKSGLNNDRSYSLDKRTYDESMLNVMAGSTNFSANSGITRTATMNMNVSGTRGYVNQIDSDTSKMNTANTLSATEAMIPFEATNDDNTRVLMSFIQTAKHQVRVAKSDPLLITSGADEALPYMTTNTFAKKMDKSGKVIALDDHKIIIEYEDGTKDYTNLDETIEKNSDGGYSVPMKLVPVKGLKVGSKVKEGQIIAYDPTSFSNSLGEDNNIAYNVGTLAKVAILCSDEGYEDSGVCTHKLSDELITQVIYKFEHVVEKDSIIYNAAKIGDKVNVGDPLLIWQDPYEDDDANIALKLMADNDVSKLGRRTIESETTGTVVDIKVFRTCELDEMSDSVRKFTEDYERPIKKLKKELESYGVDTKTLPATYALPPTGKLKKAEEAIYVEYYVQHPDIPGIGETFQ